MSKTNPFPLNNGNPWTDVDTENARSSFPTTPVYDPNYSTQQENDYLDNGENWEAEIENSAYEIGNNLPGSYGREYEELHNSSMPRSMEPITDNFDTFVRTLGLSYGQSHKEFLRSFLSALVAKPFVIFTGLSGAGKTQLSIALGKWFGIGKYQLVPVRPDWHTPTSILGFENSQSQTMNGLHSWVVPKSLEFILAACRNPYEPYLLVLEEMNLAHVEQYFADVLSGMESGFPIIPNLINDGSGWRIATSEKPLLSWPKNLFIIGSVNFDETTYQFSPKVLDRAACIEFRVPPESLTAKYSNAKQPERAPHHLVKDMLDLSTSGDPSFPDADRLANALQQVHRMLYEIDAEFGHRTFRESMRFGSLMHNAGENNIRTILDFAIAYKILPKFENERTPRLVVLHWLASFAIHGSPKNGPIDPNGTKVDEPVLPLCYERTSRLCRRLANNSPTAV